MSLWEDVFSEVTRSSGQAHTAACSFLIDLILALALSSLSLSLPARSFLVPTATCGFWLHNKGARGMFVHVYVHVSVAAPRLGKSNTELSGPR